MEPTVNGSTEEAEGTSSITLSIVGRDQQELGPSCAGWVDVQSKSMLGQTKGKLDDEEDEGVAQNSSIEDGESIQSSSETEPRDNKPTSQKATDTKDQKTEGAKELLSGAQDKTTAVSVDKNRKLSLKEALEVNGNPSPKRQSPDGLEGGVEISEEERRKKSHDAEVKSWLLERMQAPIEGTNQRRY